MQVKVSFTSGGFGEWAAHSPMRNTLTKQSFAAKFRQRRPVQECNAWSNVMTLTITLPY